MMLPMRNPRVLMALGILAALVAGGVVALSSGGDASPGAEARRGAVTRPRVPLPVVRSKLRLEEFDRADTGIELLISLPATRLNTPRTTGGARSVTLTCFGASGAKAFVVPQPWPLMEEFGYPFPHIHVPVGQRLLDTIRRCRLTGPGIDFEGSVPGRLRVVR